MTALREHCAWFLRLYAGCFFSGSTAVGAVVFAATALDPRSGLSAALAVASAVGTAAALGLISEENPPAAYAYSALFIGMGAPHTFASPALALGLATLGAAAATVLTAAVRSLLKPVGLPALTLPFALVYLCAISAGQALGVEWAPPLQLEDPGYLGFVPSLVRVFFQSLGALLFSPRIEIGFVVFVALCANRFHPALLALLAFAITMLLAHVLALSPALQFAALINATFTAIALGVGWYLPTPLGYVRAAVGAFACVLLTVAMTEPLARLSLAPISLPFNLSIYIVLLSSKLRQTDTVKG